MIELRNENLRSIRSDIRISLCPNLSVAENIYLGRELSVGGIVNRSQMVAGARSVLARLGSFINALAPVSSLSIAERQLVKIARAVHHNSQVLIMDEPTTARYPNEKLTFYSR
jgi:ribose transport system ATP-binding protein